MKKINLKNILKKTFKKKSKVKTVKKKTKSKKVKIKKPKKVGRPKLIKETQVKIDKGKEVKKNNSKNENLKLTKTLDQKPEIVKIKKQGTEKKEYKVKDYVVYPKHGVGQITEFKKINIGGIEVETYVLKFEKDKANGLCRSLSCGLFL